MLCGTLCVDDNGAAADFSMKRLGNKSSFKLGSVSLDDIES